MNMETEESVHATDTVRIGIHETDSSAQQHAVGIQETDSSAQQQDVRIQETDSSAQQQDVGIQETDSSAQQQDVRIQETDSSAQQQDVRIQETDSSAQQHDVGIQETDSSAPQQDVRIQESGSSASQQDVDIREAASSATQQNVDAQETASSAPHHDVDAQKTVVQKETSQDHAGAGSYDPNCYNMAHFPRGWAVIFNQQRTSSAHNANCHDQRTGTNVDSESLRKVVEVDLGFVVLPYNNVKADEMKTILAKVAKKDHSDADCFVCAILGHGEMGSVYGTDKSVEIKVLLGYFKGDKCQSLAGKPKLFFIQACCSPQMDAGVGVNNTDADPARGGDATFEEKPLAYGLIPTEADFLIAYSNVHWFSSLEEDKNISWFVKALTEKLRQYADKDGEKVSLQHLLIYVNKIVSDRFESNSNQISFTKKKQIPCITSMLRKDIYLKRK